MPDRSLDWLARESDRPRKKGTVSTGRNAPRGTSHWRRLSPFFPTALSYAGAFGLILAITLAPSQAQEPYSYDPGFRAPDGLRTAPQYANQAAFTEASPDQWAGSAPQWNAGEPAQ